MLKTNSKKTIENTRAYVIECANLSDYGIQDQFTPDNWKAFQEAYIPIIRKELFYRMPENAPVSFATFKHYMQGLPSSFEYFLGENALNYLAEILEETEEEKNRFTEEEAENLITKLIYRELFQK